MLIKRLNRINKIASKYFTDQLKVDRRAYDYISSRLSKQTINKFHLGYSKGDGSLIDLLNEYDISAEEAEVVGLIKTNEQGLSHEVFVDRIMFPIVHAKCVVGFGGRVLGISDNYKYINSKSSVLYRKRDVLYGLWYSRRYIYTGGFALLVEGYMDFLGLYEYDMKNCVATCGTELTKQQADAIKRWTDKVYVVSDGDLAGKKMSKKARGILAECGIEARPVKLPNNSDPYDYVTECGKTKFLKLIE